MQLRDQITFQKSLDIFASCSSISTTGFQPNSSWVLELSTCNEPNKRFAISAFPTTLKKNNKIPNYIYRKDKTVLYLAGIYDKKQFCLITESASTNILNIHHRQPVALNEEDIDNYLNLDNDGSNLLKKRNKIEFAFHEVTKNVNKTSNNDVSLLHKL